MTYIEQLIQRIKAPDKWPEFDRPDFLDDLNEIANKAIESDTVHGYLAALLIYHQLTEEMIRLLLKCSEFFVQLSIAPAEIHFPIPEKAMFGRLLDSAKSSIDFENRDSLIALAQVINKDRIDLVHGLTKQESLDEVKEKVLRTKAKFDEFFSMFNDSRDWFMLCFKDLRKDNEWDDMVSEE
jgi:hypothetical protein